MWHKNISPGKIQNEWEGLKFPKLRYVFFLYVLFPPQYPWFCNLYVKIMEFLYINTFIHFISELRCSTFQYKKNTFTFIQKSKGIATRAYQLWESCFSTLCRMCLEGKRKGDGGGHRPLCIKSSIFQHGFPGLQYYTGFLRHNML